MVGSLDQSAELNWTTERREESLHFVAHEGDFKLKSAHLSPLFYCVVVQFHRVP